MCGIWVTWLEKPEGDFGIFPAFTFGFEYGLGGYMGFQRDGSNYKDRVLFTIWSKDDQSSTANIVSSELDEIIRCGTLTNTLEGNFANCLGLYEPIVGREYKFKIESVGTDSTGELWKGTFTDMVTGQTTEIATIHLDNIDNHVGYGKLKPSAAVFLEYYYGHSGFCDENNVYSRVKWRGPYINGKLADKGYTWYPFKCMYTKQYSPEKGIIIHECGGKTAWENELPRVFWDNKK